MTKFPSSSVLLAASQGSGKTQHASALAAMLGLKTVVDGWDGRSPVPENALVLTNIPADLAR